MESEEVVVLTSEQEETTNAMDIHKRNVKSIQFNLWEYLGTLVHHASLLSTSSDWKQLANHVILIFARCN